MPETKNQLPCECPYYMLRCQDCGYETMACRHCLESGNLPDCPRCTEKEKPTRVN